MRSSLLIWLSVLILLHEAQGFNIDKASLHSFQTRKFGKEGGTSVSVRKIVGAQNSAQHTQKEQSSGNSNRKMLTKTTSDTNNSKKKENEGKKVELKTSRETLRKRKEEKVSKNEETNDPPLHRHYPDILDMAGMDYSPASRRPPIHN